MTFFAPLLFEINVCAFCVAVFVLLPRLRPSRAFAAGFLILGGSHFGLLALELAIMGRGLFLNWQLLTFFAPRWNWWVLTETTAVPGWGFALVMSAMNLWGILGGVLAVILNGRKRPRSESGTQ